MLPASTRRRPADQPTRAKQPAIQTPPAAPLRSAAVAVDAGAAARGAARRAKRNRRGEARLELCNGQSSKSRSSHVIANFTLKREFLNSLFKGERHTHVCALPMFARAKRHNASKNKTAVEPQLRKKATFFWAKVNTAVTRRQAFIMTRV